MSAVDTSTGYVGLSRVRIVILLVGYVAVGAAACRIFDRLETSLIVAPLLPSIAAIVTVQRPAGSRVVAGAAAVVVSTATAVFAAGGNVGDVADSLTSFRGLLSTEWPSPARPELVGAVALAIAAATALSDELAVHRRFHLLPAVPMFAALVAAIALSAPSGISWMATAVVVLAAVALGLARNDGTVHDRAVLLRGERRMALALVLVGLLTAAITVPLSVSARADPRDAEPASVTAALLDPIEATLALRAIDPPQVLHHVVPSGDTPVLPRHWRTAALDEYDGDRWVPQLTLRPIGETLGSVDGPTLEVDVVFLSDALSLVPLPGPPVRVEAEVETDVDRTVVRLVDPPERGESIGVVAGVAPSLSAVVEHGVATRVVDELSTFTAFAQELAGEGSDPDKLSALAATMREEFELDNSVRGGGLQQAFIDIFLRDTQRGNREQFVTGFVILAKALGFEARVATGFVTESNTLSNGVLTLSSADATVWPEVMAGDGTWVVYDPVPEEEISDVTPPTPRPQTQTPAAPQPPVPDPPDPEPEDEPVDEPVAADDPSPLSIAVKWGVRGLGAVTLVVLPFVIAAAVILGLKYRRRSRRLRAPTAAERIRGAWASATDALVDAGLSIPASATDAQIAGQGSPLVSGSRDELTRLATLSSTATFGVVADSDFLADDAVTCLRHVERSVVGEGNRRQRLRWRLSLRSLRPSTRSPVSV